MPVSGDTVLDKIPSVARLLIGGTIMGLAVSLMHYTGMAALRIQAPSNTTRCSWWHR